MSIGPAERASALQEAAKQREFARARHRIDTWAPAAAATDVAAAITSLGQASQTADVDRELMPQRLQQQR